MTRLLLLLAALFVAALALGAGCVSADATVSAPVVPGVPFVESRSQTDATLAYVPAGDEDEVRFECHAGNNYNAYNGAPGAPVVHARPLPDRLTYRLHDSGSLSILYFVEVTVVRGAVTDHYTIRV